MLITPEHVGKWFVHFCETSEPDYSLVKIVHFMKCQTVVGVFADGAGNEFWSAGVFDTNGIERGPNDGFLAREASRSEIFKYVGDS